MSLTNENGSGMVMPVGPMYGGGNGGFGGMWGDGGFFWLLVLFIFAFNGNGWGFGGGNGGGMVNTVNTDIQRGFDQQAVMGSLNGLTSAVTSGFAQAEISANARQMADMNQNFALQSALQQCCCDNRAATADLKYTVATEACADRNAVTQALQEVTAQNNANTQRILDQMCQDKIDAKNEEIANLRTQLNLANLAASQNAQTAQLMADNAAQTQALEHYLNPAPIPAYPVQNPNCCTNSCSCNRFA